MKLSPKLLEILELMNDGWELGFSIGVSKALWWIQKGGLGRGGEAKYPHGRIQIRRLSKEGLIANDGKHHFPTTPYFLTDKGKKFLKEIK